MPYFCWFFPAAAFIRTSFFHVEAIRAFKPDIILHGIAENYLSTGRPDSEAPHLLDYPRVNGREIDSTLNFCEILEREFGMAFHNGAAD